MAKKRSKGKVIIITVASLLVLILIGRVFFSGGGDDTVEVRVSKAEKRTIVQTVNAVGKIQPETEVKISSETSGEIIFLGVKEGDTVRAGQVLVRIKPDIIETQLEQYRAALEASRTDIDYAKSSVDRLKLELERSQDLFKKDFLSKQELERVKAQYDQAVSSHQSAMARYQQTNASLRQVQKSADRNTIISPIAGVVTALNVELGEKVLGTIQNVGTEMMRISDLSIMNAEVDIDENEIVLVSLGDTAKIQVDAFPDRVFVGKVIEMGHSAKSNQLAIGSQDQATNFKVKVRLLAPDAKMRPGMSCDVDLETEKVHNTLSIPLMAVTMRNRGQAEKAAVKEEEESDGVRIVEEKEAKVDHNSIVFVYKGSKVEQRRVETGISDKGYIEIRKGLSEGEEIVSGSFTAVSRLLFDGAKVKLEKKEENGKGTVRK